MLELHVGLSHSDPYKSMVVRLLNKAALFLCLMGVTLGANAQVVVDSSFGSEGALNGPNFQIPDNLGKTVGDNLFHSFTEFSLQTGQSATFTGPDAIQNILGRVTGNKVSEIDGLIKSEITGANLYLLNPKGFLFGENAKVDVDGAFTVSARESIRLGEEGSFNAVNPDQSVFVSVAPEVFGFLGDNPGGDITLNGSKLELTGKDNFIGLVGNEILLRNKSFLSVGGGGNIKIRSQKLKLTENSQITTDTNNESPAGDITIDSAEVIITEEGRVTASTLGKGKAGDIVVKAGEIRMEAGKIFSDSKSKGDGGDAGMVELEGEVINILANARVGSNTEGKGNAGVIRIKGSEVNVIDGAIQTNSNNHMEDGVAGSIEIEADRLVVRQDKGSGFIDGLISSDTRGHGDGGTMTIKAEVLELDGGQINTRSGWFSPITSGGGKAGDIGIEVKEVRMSNGAKISSSTWTQGDGGEVKISGDALVLSGGITAINTYSAYGIMGNHEEGKGGTGGKIEIGVKEVQIVAGAGISASSRGRGDAGVIKLDSESIWVDG
ncbi:filamentous hemagglutinin N-terminal domain-containing protein, partial [bacterium]|nr:filamentous hemagglutinin N-terminal domain-containing protein [bacterium]